ncbi:uncharacterized protein LOC128257343 [Drosophila gunungcola]|uniref:uncharacterized protein LOC128257343 n=1 Tax=Drosophila gunungcola TaxID=103775 RepID=UPI0022E5B9E0|nr:uncharacterized protein LOC128257343 [Drosophila gunungcola]
MKMQLIILVLAILSCGLAVEVTLNCEKCLASTDVYCINQTSYRNCIKNAPIGNVINCPTGTVCTNSDVVCVKSSELPENIVDVCGTSGGGTGCAKCTTQKFTCVSRNQFARCSDTTLINSNIYDCDTDEICVSEALDKYDNICVPSCASKFLNLKASCSNSEYTTTTTEAPTTVTPSSEQKKSACSAAATDLNIPATTKYFFTKYNADTTCRSYLYCERSGTTDWSIVYMTCTSSKPFYDSAKSVCVATKPSTCA